MSIKKYLIKEPLAKTVLIQAKISSELAAQLKPFMKKNGFKWKDVVSASLQHLRDEVKKKG